MTRFTYLKGDSFFHRMDPVMKMIWNVAVLLAAVFNFDPRYSAVWFVYLLATAMFLANIPFRQFVKSLSAFLVFAFFIAFWKTVYYVGEAHELLVWGPFRITREGMLEGVSVFFRVLVICSLSIVFTLTTDPKRMVDSLIQLAHIPYRIGYVAYAMLRFIPLYENEAQVITNAHMIRGVGETGQSLKSQFKLYSTLLVPLLVSGIRRAQAAAIAMDSRAFGAYDTRTSIEEVRVTRADVAFVAVHVLVCIAAFWYFVWLGHGIRYYG
ncbi:MAG: putative HMP/thiamine permease protein YkoC [Chloroflexi bacterium ADurb.Bin180]|nr:MAG: putative HMP/thiamine permease protein YkoC [Chloroflexi bacterium ADurb.Bin180]HNT04758.1 energy-coupling factor transporter transmembrane component T [Anaerolineae bacterium]HOU24477.1 energy-coupling factor transporter transmembrane component T [Anaerolineae bacterium]HQJ52121.1 energy-coupling factor transporter transmembrane component T [Anaerolineae bacterium]